MLENLFLQNYTAELRAGQHLMVAFGNGVERAPLETWEPPGGC